MDSKSRPEINMDCMGILMLFPLPWAGPSGGESLITRWAGGWSSRKSPSRVPMTVSLLWLYCYADGTEDEALSTLDFLPPQ